MQVAQSTVDSEVGGSMEAVEEDEVNPCSSGGTGVNKRNRDITTVDNRIDHIPMLRRDLM